MQDIEEKLNKDFNKVFAFKTDTVWGFGCNLESFEAVNKIYEIKKRDKKKPLILMSDSFSSLEKYVKNVPEYAYSLIEKYLPGGLTLIFEKSKFCPNYITPFETVGIRVPKSEDFSNLIKRVETKVLATTSCNVSGEEPVKSYNEAKEKFEKFGVEILVPISDIIINNKPSTVVLCKKERYEVLRQGEIVL